MVKLLVFAILLASSPATGFLETLFRVESSCYNGCQANFGDNPANAARLAACRKGCDYKLHDEDCAEKCKSYSSDEQNQASCQVGCTLSGSEANVVKPPMIAVDPVPEVKEPETVPSNPEPERPRSIILIRLRQRPSGEMPSMENVFSSDPFQMFNDMIRRFQEKAQSLEQNIRTSIDEKVKDAPQLPTFETINNLVKVIPLNPKPSEAREDSSSSESSEENQGKQPLLKEIEHVLQHPREQQQIIRERLEPVSNRLQQIASNLRNEWSNLVQNQPRFPVWIFLCILLSSSVILWYMLMSLCRHTPAYAPLSVRAQELVFHPYEYEGYEKEKIQPDGEIYEVTEALPIKVKLSNI